MMHESDIESKSLSQEDSLDYPDSMCGRNFSTLKKEPGWTEIDKNNVAIRPPPEFQDSPTSSDSITSTERTLYNPRIFINRRYEISPTNYVTNIAYELVQQVMEEALVISRTISWLKSHIILPRASVSTSFYSTSQLLTWSNTEQEQKQEQVQVQVQEQEQEQEPKEKKQEEQDQEQKLEQEHQKKRKQKHHKQNSKQLFWASEMLPSSSSLQANSMIVTITPYNTLNRPTSRSSLASSRLSSSHNSINTSGLCRNADDSSFITSAMSHDVLTMSEISDMYNVPLDSDIYTVPVDVVRQRYYESRFPQRARRHRHHRKRKRNVSTSSQSELESHMQPTRHYCSKPRAITHVIKSQKLLTEVFWNNDDKNVDSSIYGNEKRHSVPGTSCHHTTTSRHQINNHEQNNVGEPIHMTLHEVRQYLETLYSNSSDSSENKMNRNKLPTNKIPIQLSMQKNHITAVVDNNINKYSSLQINATLLIDKANNGLINSNNNNNNNSFNNNDNNNNNIINANNNTNTYNNNNNSNSSSSNNNNKNKNKNSSISNENNNNSNNNNNNNKSITCFRKHKKNNLIHNQYKKTKDIDGQNKNKNDSDKDNNKIKKSHRNFPLNLKRTLCNIFRFRRLGSSDYFVNKKNTIVQGDIVEQHDNGSNRHIDINSKLSNVTLTAQKLSLFNRALPPLPRNNGHVNNIEQAQDVLTAIINNKIDTTSINSSINHISSSLQDNDLPLEDSSMDFAASIEKVKDYGWYWGPMSGEAAEKILSNEPDGSFIVRDSSDDHYIFSLSFRLNNCVRHVRIEHDQGNFSFGNCTKFKSHTIVDFIENAVEHSRSGRYLFFLHRRPVLGPMRVQLLHPVSRFKQVQSLQHICRFVILKMVRRDLISTLPLPRRLIDYLSMPHYYSEQFDEQDDRAESPVSSSTGELEKICFISPSLL
ncbi:myb-like protein I isoform X2 [Aphidius gifuensis]|uniref:myb-like protein I isoform X2 n=1 Tax=Aphidius gifuensis TaxID=684658 RepID=UPI001CDCEDC5|nr:myb-like protein I isoform X2 [Aphidius gifuensis]